MYDLFVQLLLYMSLIIGCDWLSLSLYGILRCLWHSVRVLQLFVEHLVMKNEDLASYARRLHLVNVFNIGLYKNIILIMLGFHYCYIVHEKGF